MVLLILREFQLYIGECVFGGRGQNRLIGENLCRRKQHWIEVASVCHAQCYLSAPIYLTKSMALLIWMDFQLNLGGCVWGIQQADWRKSLQKKTTLNRCYVCMPHSLPCFFYFPKKNNNNFHEICRFWNNQCPLQEYYYCCHSDNASSSTLYEDDSTPLLNVLKLVNVIELLFIF